jgi:hypothetical protein
MVASFGENWTSESTVNAASTMTAKVEEQCNAGSHLYKVFQLLFEKRYIDHLFWYHAYYYHYNQDHHHHE